MLDTTDATVAGKQTCDAPPGSLAAAAGHGAQAPEIPGFGIDRRTRWSVPRKSARPINLERRARFARFDVA